MSDSSGGARRAAVPKLQVKAKYPTVNYIGNKEKLSDWICDNIPSDVTTVFDAFSGGSSVAYALKRHGKTVIANDIMKINYILAQALIENSSTTLSDDDLHTLCHGTPAEGFVYEHYADKLFYPDECMQLDLYRNNIEKFDDPYKRALAYALIRRAAIRKMPYSRFNIRWDKVQQLRDEEYSYLKYKRRRAYHNQSFEHHIRANAAQYNSAVFDNGQPNQAHNLDALEAVRSLSADLIYLDPPYTGTMNNYYDFYSFLDNYIDQTMRPPFANNFIDKKTILDLFDTLFAGLGNFKYWLLSYNSSSYPDKDTLLALITKYAKSVTVIERKHTYKITGKANKSSNTEYLFIAERR